MSWNMVFRNQSAAGEGTDLGLGVEVLGEVLVEFHGGVLGTIRCMDGLGGSWGRDFTRL